MEQVKIYESKEPKNNSTIVNSIHKNAITTDTLGISEYVQDCVNSIWVNTIEALFSKEQNLYYDTIYSYIVRYGANMDTSLGFHVDDSLITINLCLNDDFEGSDLIFQGIRCPIHIDSPCVDNEKVHIKHQKGLAVLHHGKNRHYIEPIERGERYNLIVWCQNQEERKKWFYSQQNDECINFCKFYKQS